MSIHVQPPSCCWPGTMVTVLNIALLIGCFGKIFIPDYFNHSRQDGDKDDEDNQQFDSLNDLHSAEEITGI